MVHASEIVFTDQFPTLPAGATAPENIARFDGDTLTVKAGKPGRELVKIPFDFAPYAGRMLEISADVRYTGVSKPPQAWNGVKLMMVYPDGDGKLRHEHPAGRFGDSDWIALRHSAPIQSGAGKGYIALGLEEASGEVSYRNLKLAVQELTEIYPAFSPAGYQAVYTDGTDIDRTTRRGMMSPSTFTPEVITRDLPDLKHWGANLIRWQLIRNWNTVDSDQNVDDYLNWINARIPEIRQVLDKARELEIKVVLDLHVPPGGRRPDNDMHMFYNRKFADAYLEAWRRLATAFKGDPALYGFDLINEPCQKFDAPINYLELQFEAAKLVRAIDPVTPIIIESNNWASADTFVYLTPLPLENIIYQVHMYHPGNYTHQGVGKRPLLDGAYPGKLGNAEFNREILRQHLAPVREFQKKYNAKIYVGEFSAIRWAKGGDAYLRDCIAIFEEYGWDWSYHAFREWSGWSVEHGEERRDETPRANTARKRVLLEGLQKNHSRTDK